MPSLPGLLPVGVAVPLPDGGAHLTLGPEVRALDADAARAWSAARQGGDAGPLGAPLRAAGYLAAPEDAPLVRLVRHRPVPDLLAAGPGRALEHELWTWSTWDPSLHDVVRRLVPPSPLLDPDVLAATTARAAWSAVARWVLAGVAHLDTALATVPRRPA